MTNHDDLQKGHEARHTSHTRFGPRPVPQPGRRPQVSTLTHKGGRDWPTSTLTSKIVVWGGIGIMAAAGTTAAILGARKVADMVSGPDDDDAAGNRAGGRGNKDLAPRFADLDDDHRDAVRSRVRAQANEDRKDAARMRAAAARRRAAGAPPRRSGKSGKRNLAGDITASATSLSSSLNSVMESLTGLVSGFRSVATQAGGIVREFSEAADTVRGFLGDAADFSGRKTKDGGAGSSFDHDRGGSTGPRTGAANSDRMHRM